MLIASDFYILEEIIRIFKKLQPNFANLGESKEPLRHAPNSQKNMHEV